MVSPEFLAWKIRGCVLRLVRRIGIGHVGVGERCVRVGNDLISIDKAVVRVGVHAVTVVGWGRIHGGEMAHGFVPDVVVGGAP
jgi:hypothetical protein